MDPGFYAMRLRRNAVEPLRMQLEDPAGPMNITGYSLKLQVRLYAGQPGSPKLSLDSVTGGIVIEDAATGLIEVKWDLVADAIRLLPSTAEAGDPTSQRVDTFAYDLLLVGAFGAAQAILEGPVFVSFGVTTL